MLFFVRCCCGAVLIILFNCKGKLTSDERREVRKVIEVNKIRKIAKIDIIEAALAYGKLIAVKTNEVVSNLADTILIDSLQQMYGVKIRLLHPAMKGGTKVERQIMEAYLAVTHSDYITDNVQSTHGDSILYTMPITKKVTSDSVRFAYALEIIISTQQAILFMDRRKESD